MHQKVRQRRNSQQKYCFLFGFFNQNLLNLNNVNQNNKFDLIILNQSNAYSKQHH